MTDFPTYRRTGVLLLVLAALAAAPRTATAQAAQPFAQGLYNWIHSTGDAERAFPFYRDILGIELVRSPFAGPAPAGAPPPRIAPTSEAGSDQLIWNLTDTQGSRFRNVFMEAPNTPFGLELSEFLDIDRAERPANPWDPGASRLIFHVRDLGVVLDRLEAAGAPVVSIGGGLVDGPLLPAILVRDPDGYLVEIAQATPGEIARVPPPVQIVSTAIGLTVADTARALRFYRDLLGFRVRGTRTSRPGDLRLNGLTDGEMTQTEMTIPGTTVPVFLNQFTLPAGAAEATPIAWRIQDVGAPQFQLQVRDLDTLIPATMRAGYRFLSLDAQPIQRAFGRFVFAIDPDGVLVEFVEPAAR